MPPLHSHSFKCCVFLLHTANTQPCFPVQMSVSECVCVRACLYVCVCVCVGCWQVPEYLHLNISINGGKLENNATCCLYGHKIRQQHAPSLLCHCRFWYTVIVGNWRSKHRRPHLLCVSASEMFLRQREGASPSSECHIYKDQSI